MKLVATKELLAERVRGLQGAKATQLVADDEVVLHMVKSEDNVPQALDELVAEGRLVEVEYVLPDMGWRAKSFYLPAGSTVRVLNGRDEKMAAVRELFDRDCAVESNQTAVVRLDRLRQGLEAILGEKT